MLVGFHHELKKSLLPEGLTHAMIMLPQPSWFEMMCKLRSPRAGKSFGVLLGVLLLWQITPLDAAFNWTLNGVFHSQPAVQLWYEGYWKQVRGKVQAAMVQNWGPKRITSGPEKLKPCFSGVPVAIMICDCGDGADQGVLCI